MGLFISDTAPRRRAGGRRRQKARLALERLEDRRVPSGYQQINLVGYQPGMAARTDPLLNGWGIDYAPDGAFCVANASSRTATFYDAHGKPQPTVIHVPAAAGQDDLPFGPTGVVYNPTSDFVISANGRSAPATFLFDTLDGLICGWNPRVDATHAIVVVDDSAPTPTAFASSYTALALVKQDHGHSVLFACDSGISTTETNNRIDMLDGHFHTIGSFTDPGVNPQVDGTAFQVEDVGDKLFVTFAGFVAPYGGVVDRFDLPDVLNTSDGPPTVHRFAYNAPGNGPLVAPWAITLAPDDFGAFSRDLLIGNVEGAGNINAFDPRTGQFLGQLEHPNGSPIAIPGLWDLKFGGGSPANGRTNDLYFAAGFTGEDPTGNGLFGVLRAAGNQGAGDDQQTNQATAPPSSVAVGGGRIRFRKTHPVEQPAVDQPVAIVASPWSPVTAVRHTLLDQLAAETDDVPLMSDGGIGAGAASIV
jgi:uncharacterized protein (TIGR03118 family)